MSDFQSKQIKTLVTEVQFGSPISSPADKANISPITNGGISPLRGTTPPKREIPIDLGSKVFLLSSEVERLTHLNARHIQEIEMWKSKYASSANNTTTIKIDESMISQKKQQEYEMTQYALSQEIAKLQENLKGKDNEIAYWKDKYLVLEQTMDNKIKTALEIKIHEINATLNKDRVNYDVYRLHLSESEEKIRGLMVEVRRITDILEVRTQESQSANEKYLVALKERDTLNDRCNTLLKQVTETQARISQLVSENSQLAVEIRQRDNNLNLVKALNFKIEELTGDNTTLSQRIVELSGLDDKVKTSQFQINNLEQLLQAARKENIDLTQRIRETAMHYEEQIKNLKEQIVKNTQDIYLYRGLEYENDQLKKKINELNDMRELQQNQYYKKESELNDIILKLRTEIYDNEKMMKMLQEKFIDFERKIQIFILDNERLNATLKEKDDYIQRVSRADYELLDLKNKYDVLSKENAIMKSDITVLLAENGQMKDDLPKLIEENQNMKIENDELRKNNELLAESEKKSSDDIDMLKTQLMILKQSQDTTQNELAVRVSQLEAENDRLTSDLRIHEEQVASLVQECQNWSDKYELLQKESASYKDAILLEMEKHFSDRLDSERNEQDRVIATKDNQIRDLTDQIAELLSQIRQLQQENRTLKNELDFIVQQHDDVKDQHEKAKKSSQNDQKNQDLLKRKINELEADNTAKEQAIKEFELKQIMLFIEIERLYLINGEFMEHIANLDTTCANLAKELELTKRKNADTDNFSKIVLGLKQQIENLENRNNILLNENSKLSELSLQRLKELDELKNKYVNSINETARRSTTSINPLGSHRRTDSDVQEQTMKYENEIQALRHEVKQLKAVLELKQNEINKLREINDARKTDMDALKRDIQNNPRIRQLEGENRLLADQVEQIKREFFEMKKTRDVLRAELEKETKKNVNALNNLVRDSVTNNTQDSPQRNTFGGNRQEQFNYEDPYNFYTK